MSKKPEEEREAEAEDETGDDGEIESGVFAAMYGFEGGGFRGIRAVGAIAADAGAEIVANGAWRGFLRVGGAHGVAPLQDGAFCFEDHGEDFAGAHEIGEFGEEGALFVDRVEAAGF